MIEEAKIDSNAPFPNDGQCEFCDQRDATTLCSNCNQIFCDDCKAGHKRLKIALNHEFLPLDKYDPRKKIATCPIHPEHQLSVFCQGCKVNICAMCSTASHNGHNVVFLKETTESVRIELEISKNEVLFLLF